ncbi:MAG: hydroxymethylbilane synthase [Salinivirgaceae bacterium]|jgi:hydroxymethylbilane synthase|nr:hydroxymethylbilane synthase [Salinivirgaceae bacterium]
MALKNIKIGTRGSQLALYQAETVKATIEGKFPEISAEIVIIHSKGDKILDVALSKIGDKGLFTKELEEVMFRGEIDMAVHSLKDLPTTLPEGLKIGGVLPRGEVRDALVSIKGLTLKDLTPDMKIATSSLRRKAQLLKINPEFNIVDIRGNVNTRLRKMEEGYCDAMMMAATGLQRIGLDKYITEVLNTKDILPAVSQGAIAMETKIGDANVDEIVAAITHDLTFKTTNAERIFLRKLEGGCQIPIGCFSEIEGENVTMSGFMAYVDGTNILENSITGKLADADKIASKLADYFIANGSVKLLERIRNYNTN